jgi:pimeloyl-[acyl-carrier protein] methyl ester esterase
MTRILLSLLFLIWTPTFALAASPAAFQSDRIVVEVRGEGPDVILIPGLASTSAVCTTAIACTW